MPGRFTVADVYTAWSAALGHISAKTKATRRTVWNTRVQPRWGALAVAEVKTSAVKSWVAAMVSDGAGVPTIENTFGVLRQVMGAALEDNRIARNPCDGVKLPKRMHADRGYLSHAQVAVLATLWSVTPQW
jgi:site-specific recombinase XerC